jgi:hypothetical protein
MRWVGHVARIEDRRATCKFSVKKPMERDRRTRHRREGNIKMNIKRSGLGRHGMD